MNKWGRHGALPTHRHESAAVAGRPPGAAGAGVVRSRAAPSGRSAGLVGVRCALPQRRQRGAGDAVQGGAVGVLAGHRNGKGCTIGGYAAIKFRAPEAACNGCPLRTKCLRKPDTTRSRQLAILTRKTEGTHTQRMRERIDSAWGREQYGRRFATVEPVFGNVRANKRLNRFTLRGQAKVDGQWKLFALVHNIEKWANYRKAA